MQFVAPELQRDWQVVLTAVDQDGTAMIHAAQELRLNRSFVAQAVKQLGVGHIRLQPFKEKEEKKKAQLPIGDVSDDVGLAMNLFDARRPRRVAESDTSSRPPSQEPQAKAKAVAFAAPAVEAAAAVEQARSMGRDDRATFSKLVSR